jgi:hypothetical protein
VETLRQDGQLIAAYQHERPWIDVNDAADVSRAETLVIDHAGEFELWDGSPDLQVSLLLLASPVGIWLVPPSGSRNVQPHRWSLPLVWTKKGGLQPPVPAIATATQDLITFDEPDLPNGRVRRYRVVWTASAEAITVPVGRWMPWAAASSPGTAVSSATRRALAVWRVRAPMLFGGERGSSGQPQDSFDMVPEPLRPA